MKLDKISVSKCCVHSAKGMGEGDDDSDDPYDYETEELITDGEEEEKKDEDDGYDDNTEEEVELEMDDEDENKEKDTEEIKSADEINEGDNKNKIEDEKGEIIIEEDSEDEIKPKKSRKKKKLNKKDKKTRQKKEGKVARNIKKFERISGFKDKGEKKEEKSTDKEKDVEDDGGNKVESNEKVPFFYYITPKAVQKIEGVEQKPNVPEEKGPSKFKKLFVRKGSEIGGSKDNLSEKDDNSHKGFAKMFSTQKNGDSGKDPFSPSKKIVISKLLFKQKSLSSDDESDTESESESKKSDTESCTENKRSTLEIEKVPSDEMTTPRQGINKIKDWLHKKDGTEHKVEECTEVAVVGSRNNSLKRLFRRSRTEEEPTSPDKETKTQFSRSNIFSKLGRKYHSEDTSEVSPTSSLNEEQVTKSGSLPRKFWFKSRGTNDRAQSPLGSEANSIPPASSESGEENSGCRSPPSDMHNRRKRLSLSLKGMVGIRPPPPPKIADECFEGPLEPMKSDSLHRTPSYELALSTADLVAVGIPKKGLFETSSLKLKKMFKGSDSVDKTSAKEQEKDNKKDKKKINLKLKSNKEVSKDSSIQHPSVNKYIDETPTSICPPSDFSDILDSKANPPISSDSTNDNTCKSINDPPSADPPQTLESDCSSNDNESLAFDHPPLEVPVDNSFLSTLERKLTFSLPFSSGGTEEENVRPVERAVEARTHTADYVGSMVRCLHLTKCFIANSKPIIFPYFFGLVINWI